MHKFMANAVYSSYGTKTILIILRGGGGDMLKEKGIKYTSQN